ncbi:MAG: hypothetical protein ACTHMM_27015 [Agriterribacter sp.]
MDTKEKRMRDRLVKLQHSLEVAEKSEILSIYGEWGEHMFIPYIINVSVKNFVIKELKEQITHLKTILE